MTEPEISGIAPFFIVKNVPAALAFYRDRLGFDITFQGPDPDDIFFGIVERGAAMIMLKDVGVDPLPNYKRDVEKDWARWDAYVPDPDALAAESSSRNVECSQPLKTTMQQENAGHVPRFAPICDRAALRRALSANHVPGEVVRGDSRQTGNQRNGSAWNLRFRAEEAREYAGSAHTAAARRSGAGDHAGPARDAHAHRAATAAEYES